MLRPIKGQQRALGGPGRAAPRLISRVWLYGPTDGGVTTVRNVDFNPPAGAGWIDARAIGAGGGCVGGSGWGAGGAAYARGGAPISRASKISCAIGGQADMANNGAASSVSANGVPFVLAAGGGAGGASSGGVGGLDTNCIGTIRRSGSNGDGAVGGASASDAQDADTLGLGGNARVNPATLRVRDGTAPPILTDYGSGGFSSTGFVPASPVTTGWSGDGRVGGPGVVVLEFWTRKPT